MNPSCVFRSGCGDEARCSSYGHCAILSPASMKPTIPSPPNPGYDQRPSSPSSRPTGGAGEEALSDDALAEQECGYCALGLYTVEHDHPLPLVKCKTCGGQGVMREGYLPGTTTVEYHVRCGRCPMDTGAGWWRERREDAAADWRARNLPTAAPPSTGPAGEAGVPSGSTGAASGDGPETAVAATEPACIDCGAGLNAGEAKCFTVCDACWAKAYPQPGTRPAGEREAVVKPGDRFVHIRAGEATVLDVGVSGDYRERRKTPWGMVGGGYKRADCLIKFDSGGDPIAYETHLLATYDNYWTRLAPATSDPSARPAGERCPICGWPLAASADQGCTRGNCSYRPREGTAEYDRIQERRRSVAGNLSSGPSRADRAEGSVPPHPQQPSGGGDEAHCPLCDARMHLASTTGEASWVAECTKCDGLLVELPTKAETLAAVALLGTNARLQRDLTRFKDLLRNMCDRHETAVNIIHAERVCDGSGKVQDCEEDCADELDAIAEARAALSGKETP